MQAFEVTGTIDPTGRLILDQPLQVSHPGRIRLIVLLEESDSHPSTHQVTQTETPLANKSATNQPAFDPNAIPIWELAAQITASVPAEEWAKLPPDLAQNFDYYQSLRDDS